jgi:hypothetical protein
VSGEEETLEMLFAGVLPVAPVAPVRRTPTTCKNVNICHMQSTSRKCTYPAGCNENVCRNCKMCISHFEFEPFAPIAPVALEIWD